MREFEDAAKKKKEGWRRGLFFVYFNSNGVNSQKLSHVYGQRKTNRTLYRKNRRFKKQKSSLKFNHLMTGGENSYMLKQTYKF